MCYVFSAVIHRLDSYLIALEAFDLLGLETRPDLALEAVTKDSDNTDEHTAEQIHVQRGQYLEHHHRSRRKHSFSFLLQEYCTYLVYIQVWERTTKDLNSSVTAS